jgi:hypothetical protein
MRNAIAAVSALALAASLAAQAASPAPFAFTGGILLGSDVMPSGAAGLNGQSTGETWTSLSFQPDIALGSFGLGLDLGLHFKLYPSPDRAVEVYEGDWVPSGSRTFLDVYLPKLLYVRYGQKGADPLFVKLGSLGGLSLGDGFIVDEYSNMRFLPQRRIFGLDLGLDGELFDFPYLGFEALAGNLARLDVMGGRLFARPLAATQLAALKDAQVGITAAVDTAPYLYSGGSSASPVAAYGADLLVPIFVGPLFPLSAFTDVALDPNKTFGWMIGLDGRLVGVITYGAQFRVLQDGFLPSYFDANYDIYRARRYDAMQLVPSGGTELGYLASLGLSLLSEQLVVKATLDGPFDPAGPASTPSAADQREYPHLRGILRLGQVGNFPLSFDSSYDKYSIGASSGFFEDLIDPTDAVLGFAINYKTGASVLSLRYDATWDPSARAGGGAFVASSSLQASIKF